MIELLYFASQIQCSAGGDFLNIQMDVYHNQELVETLSLNDKVLLDVDSIKDLTFEYTAVGNPDCGLSLPSELVLAPNDSVPTMAGLYEQQSIQDMLSDLNEYEELLLVELGTTNQMSPAFDRQDVVVKVNNEPSSTQASVPKDIILPD